MNNNQTRLSAPAGQDTKVLTYLKENGSITPLDALRDIGCFRLAALIHNLRKKGHHLSAKRVTRKVNFAGVSFAEYRLETEL